jgi:predicted metal-dependent hydrolase
MIHYNIIYSGRRSIGIIVSPESGVTVRAPYRTSLKTIEDLVQSKSAWIKKHLDNHSSLIRINRNSEYKDGEYHYFGGRQYLLKIIQSESCYVKLYENIIEIGMRSIEDKAKVSLLLQKWYKNMAEEHFRKKLQELLSRFSNYNFSPTNLSVRAMKGRWGSCTSKGKITLSTELVKLNDKYIEYVIVHELCHLKHHNHSPAYYKLLSEVCPEWVTVRKELRGFIR